MRYKIEGVWSGYNAGQRKPCHREYTTSKKRVEEVKGIGGSIIFTDGTYMSISVEECKPREKTQPIHGYSVLLSDCIRYGTREVAEIQRLKDLKS